MQGAVCAKLTAIPKACARPIRPAARYRPKGRGAIFEHRQPASLAATDRRRALARDRRVPAPPGNCSFPCQGNRR
jgi:hypothetical protein